MPQHLSIYFTSGRSQGETIVLTDSISKLGRSSKNDIKIVDDKASRFHAEIRVVGHEASLIDLHSSNGTFLNGERVQMTHLRNGDVITIGGTRMVFSNPFDVSEIDSDLVLQISHDDESDELIPDEFRTTTTPSRPRAVIRGSLPQPEGFEIAKAPIVVAKSQPQLQIIIETLNTIRNSVDEATLLNEVLERVSGLTGADRGGALIYCMLTGDFLPTAVWQRDKAAGNDARLRISDTILKFVVESRQSVLTNDARTDERWDQSDSVKSTGVHEAICAPMIGRDGILGIIYLDTHMEREASRSGIGTRRFSPQHLDAVTAVAQQAAMALELSRYYSALVESARLAAVGELTANMSHNIKNSMQGIKSGAYLIENGIKNRCWETLEKGWKVVSEQQESCFYSFMNVLNYSLPKTPCRSAICLATILDRVKQNADPHAGRHHVELITDANGFDDTDVYVDEHGILHAVLNLVINAIDACIGRPHATVVLSASLREEGMVEICVRDNGIGIPANLRPNLFKHYVSTKGHNGTGLGLMSVKKIVDEHEGTITFESVDQIGTVFTLMIPISSPTTSSPPTQKSEASNPPND